MIEDAGAFNTKRGCPANQLLLTPKWDSQGAYSLHLEGGSAAAKNNITGDVQPFPKEFLSQVADPNKLQLSRNFSLKSAKVVDPAGYASYPLTKLFPEPPCMEPARRARLGTPSKSSAGRAEGKGEVKDNGKGEPTGTEGTERKLSSNVQYEGEFGPPAPEQ